MILDALRNRWPWMKHLSDDAAHDRTTLMDQAAFMHFTIEVVRGLAGQTGFVVQPRRWVVERTFGWLMRWRRPGARLREAHRCLGKHDVPGDGFFVDASNAFPLSFKQSLNAGD
jgi:transposase